MIRFQHGFNLGVVGKWYYILVLMFRFPARSVAQPAWASPEGRSLRASTDYA